jgi:hypothetical protein
MAAKLYRLKLSICVGPQEIIPVLPKVNAYRSITIGQPMTKKQAEALQKKMCEWNPGYLFGVTPAQRGD